jgi:hypothetical protein
VLARLPTGLEASSSINSSQLQLQARQLHNLASSCTMLQQQLLALTNQVDPAAATLLAAAAAGDKDANAAFCRHEAGSAGRVSRAEQCKLSSSSGSSGCGLAGQDCLDADGGSSSLCSWLPDCRVNADSTAGKTTQAVAARGSPERSSSSAGGGGGVLRHLPVTMLLLLLLENSLQEVSSAMASKAAAGRQVQSR